MLDSRKIICCNDNKDDRLIKGPSNALALFSNHIENIKIVTLCKSFDEMLGGGFPRGNLIEICGSAGIGKTQFCLQTSISVQVPICIGGLGGQAVYIDTEGSFSTDRLLQIANYTIRHCQKISKTMNLQNKELDEIKNLTEREMLNNIHYFRCTKQNQLMALTHRLNLMCKNNPKICLIIIDSLAFHFRYDVDDIPKRNQLLTVFGQNMSSIASQFGVSVILTNQMTTKFNNGVGYLAPALGDSWGHICPIRIQLQEHSSTVNKSFIRQHQAVLLKHTSQPIDHCRYQITIGGIRDTID